jgi:hypothetical protein
MTAHYVGVFIPLESGGWKAVFPDFPYFEIQEPYLDLAIFRGAKALAEIKLANGTPIPAPRNLAAIKADLGWQATAEVDWHTCVVRMLPMRGVRDDRTTSFSAEPKPETNAKIYQVGDIVRWVLGNTAGEAYFIGKLARDTNGSVLVLATPTHVGIEIRAEDCNSTGLRDSAQGTEYRERYARQRPGRLRG